ncbi:MAG: hypothetical protein NTX75_00925 [Proteobacteria bacterium]|nr:hypothetical protein [Pseudomonadota bacterium]
MKRYIIWFFIIAFIITESTAACMDDAIAPVVSIKDNHIKRTGQLYLPHVSGQPDSHLSSPEGNPCNELECRNPFVIQIYNEEGHAE